MQICMLRRSAGVFLCVLLAACGGSGTTIPGASQNTSAEPSAASGELQGTISRNVSPAYQPAPNPNEELLITTSSCQSGDGLGGPCAYPQSFNPTINRYSLSSGTALPSINLESSSYGGPSQSVVSAGDQYFLSSEPTPDQNQVEVDTVNGTASNIPNAASLLLMSTDLTTALLVRNTSVTVYRAPFTQASGSAPVPSGTALVTNNNGSELFAASSNGSKMTATVETLSTGKMTTVSWNTNQSVSNLGTYDARHAWYYFLSSNGNGAAFRVQIVDVGHQKYLGYLNLGGAPPTLNVDPTSSDLYVPLGSRIYVYNVGACGCASPRRILKTTLPYVSAVIDRNNQHLIAWGVSASPQGFSEYYFDDLNPQTGAVQRTYPSLVDDDSTQYQVWTVLAQ